MILALPAAAQTVTLTPADPQPAEAALQQGLAVSYAYPSKVRTLADATRALENAEPGDPLLGFSYLDGNDGDLTLTSGSAHKVAASISGYIRFDAPGTYMIEVISNDGIDVSIGGQQVGLYDEVHACESAGVTEVEVPSAGWYEVEATYFQRKGSACLLMDWSQGGEMEPVPDEAFAYTE
jgi:hypothetical protein